jgi:hypothetical protein
MKKYFSEFLKSSWQLEIWSDKKRVYWSKKSGVKGLLDFIKKHKRRFKKLIIFDKKIGNAAALLFVYLKTEEVFGAIGSRLAKKTLRKYKIRFYFKKTIPNILNKKRNSICLFEKKSLNKKPEEFYKSLKK